VVAAALPACLLLAAAAWRVFVVRAPPRAPTTVWLRIDVADGLVYESPGRLATRFVAIVFDAPGWERAGEDRRTEDVRRVLCTPMPSPTWWESRVARSRGSVSYSARSEPVVYSPTGRERRADGSAWAEFSSSIRR